MAVSADDNEVTAVDTQGAAPELEATRVRRVAAGDTGLIDIVRAASALARAESEVVIFELGRAVVCSALSRHVLQPRPLHPAEEELGAGIRHAVDASCAAFAITGRAGVVVGSLTVRSMPSPETADGLHALARLAAARLTTRRDAVALDVDAQRNDDVLAHLRDAVMVVDDSFTITFATPSTGTLIGRTPDELLGTSAIDLVHPADLDRAFDAVARLSEGREVYRTAVRLQHANGEYVRIEVTGTDALHVPTLAGTVLSLRSDDRHLELAEELDREQRTLAAVVDQLHDGVIAIDRFGAPVIVNRVARRMHELDPLAPREELRFDLVQMLDIAGRPLDPTHHPVERARRGTEVADDELTIIGTAGRTSHVSVSSRPIEAADGSPLGVVIGFHDVSAARRGSGSCVSVPSTIRSRDWRTADRSKSI